MKDLIEQAIFSVDQPLKNTHPNTHSGKDKSMEPHRHPCCSFCKSFGTLVQITLDDGKKALQCKKCGHVAKKAVYMKNSGANVSETFVGKAWDIGDGRLPSVKEISLLSKPALDWLIWSQTSIGARDKQKAKRLFEEVRWWVYMGIVDGLEPERGETTEELSQKVFLLMSELIWGARAGKSVRTTKEIAEIIGVDRSQFSKSRRWGKIRMMIEGLFMDWEHEVITVMLGDKV